ncbi:hypothetical protein [Ammoniphilus sp. CFH 90114]|uniref:hypothetical protein n=1 Tax=Ammoniphilus sp. CFH 90114 TaxID=2493665 RepID=UPI0013E93278|nr:hypothetical protein [Ammoniphilus sp. CFH 90114]
MTFFSAINKLMKKKKYPHEVIRLTPGEKNSIAIVLGSLLTMVIVTAISFLMS